MAVATAVYGCRYVPGTATQIQDPSHPKATQPRGAPVRVQGGGNIVQIQLGTI